MQQSKARDNFDDMQYNNVHKQSQSQISAFLLKFSSRNKESSGTFYNNTEQNGIFENLNLKYISVEQQKQTKMAPLKKVKKLCDLCLKNVTEKTISVLLKIRELDDEDESDGKMKLLNEYFAHNLPQSACADILDSILQDGNMDNDTKVR